MALEERSVEIILNGGLDVKESEEAEQPMSFRKLDGFRFGELGKLERTPAESSGVSTELPGFVAETDYAHTLFSRGRDIAFLTKGRGVGRFDDGYTPALIRQEEAVGAVASKPSSAFNPLPCSVSRMVLHSTQPGWSITAATSTKTPYGNFVIAWIESDGTNDDVMHMRAYTADGTFLSEANSYQGFLLVGGDYTLKSCERNGATDKGAYITVVADDGSAPYPAYTYRYVDNGQDPGEFEFQHVASSNLGTTAFSLADAADGVGDPSYYFMYQDDTTGFLTVLERDESGGSPTVHSGTHPYADGVIIRGNASILLASFAIGTVWTEKLGSPGTLGVQAATAGGEGFLGVAGAPAAHDGYTDACDLFVEVQTTGGLRTKTRVVSVEYDSSGSVIVEHDEPNASPTSDACSWGGRAFCGLRIEGRAVMLASPRDTTAGQNVDPVARLFHARSSADNSLNSPLASWEYDGSVFVAGAADVNRTIMVCRVDMADKAAPLPWVEVNGVTMLAAGLLVEYDGSHVTESQPHHRPTILLTAVGGGGAISIRAVYSWIDAAGNLHRSEPSNAIVTTVGANIKALVPSLLSYDNISYREAGITLYVTEVGGSIHYETGAVRAVDSYNQIYTFTNVQAGSSGSAPLYTEGGELASEPPPAMHDIALVSDRLVGINAEDRQEWWVSKTFREGIGVEWSTFLRGRLPEDAEAVVEMNGLITFLGKTSVWVLYGEGPNNAGSGTFAPPRKAAEVGCVSRASVVRVPSGVMFQSHRGFVLLDSGFNAQNVGLPVEPENNPLAYTVRRAIYDRANEEVRVVGHPASEDFGILSLSAGTEYFYSLRESKWSKLSTGVVPTIAIEGMVAGGRVWLAKRDSTIRKVLARNESGYNRRSGTAVWETPWVKLDGIVGYGRIWEMLLSLETPAENLSSNVSLEIALYYDYDDSSYVTTWQYNQVQMASWEEDAVEVLELLPGQQRAQAFKLRVTTSGGSGGLSHSGVIPLALRVRYGVSPAGARRRKTNRRKGPLVEV